MRTKSIHIVALDVPFPPNYGGAIDIFNRAKSLKNAGWKVTLHCFEYGRGREHNFSECADEIFYYPRRNWVLSLLSRQPYIVASRWNAQLLHRLLSTSAPILLEGQHCSGYANILKKHQKKCAIRVHNIEWQYYHSLAKLSGSVLKKLFFNWESNQLKRHELTILDVPLLCITAADQHYYEQLGAEAIYLPTTLDWEYQDKPTNSTYWLYHGNLSVPENEDAVRTICGNLTSNSQVSIKIAGKSPSSTLKERISRSGHLLIENPNQTEMALLIEEAQGHLLISHQETGIKLKLLHALASGKPCVVNAAMVAGTDLGQFCTIWDETSDLGQLLAEIIPLSPAERTDRMNYLHAAFGTEKVNSVIAQWINL